MIGDQLKRQLVGLIFFFSGFAALVYQVAWQRVLTQAIGVDSVAIAFIVTIFMIGLGIGALLGGAAAKRFSRILPYIYSSLELLVGVFGWVSVEVVRTGNRLAAQTGIQSLFFDFIVNCSILVVPILLMGMTTPVIIEYLKDRVENFGRTIGVFYGVNVLGAALGAIGSLFLIELVGLVQLTVIAGSINLLLAAAFLAIALMRRSATTPREATYTRVTAQVEPLTALGISTLAPQMRFAAFLFGFASLSIQMVLLRLLIFYFAPLSFVFPLGLCSFLIMMTLGQMLGGRMVDAPMQVMSAKAGAGRTIAEMLGSNALLSDDAARRYLPLLLALLAVAATLLVVNIPLRFLDIIRPSVSKNIYALPFGLVISLVLMLPVVFTSAFLPVVSRIALKDIRSSGEVFGGVLFWSTLGNIAGTFLTALVLFDVIGSIPTLLVIFAVLFAGALLLLGPPERQDLVGLLRLQGWSRIIVPAMAAAVLLLLVPFNYYKQTRSGNLPFLKLVSQPYPSAILEGHSSVTAVFPNGTGIKRVEVRPFNAGAAAAIQDTNAVYYRYYSLAVPQIVDPSFRPKRVMLIGLGSGELPFVMRELPFVEEFVIVELSPEVMQAYETMSATEIAETVRHPKVRVHVTDGRRYVQKALLRGEKFDLIQIGILGLTLAGASNIYSADFFASVRALLNPGGYLALEPRVGIARIAFDVLPFGYVLQGSSWLFMHEKPLNLSNPAQIAIDDLQSNLYHATTFADLKAAATKPATCKTIKAGIFEYNRDQIRQLFPTMVGTDDWLIFEYFYLSELRPNFVWPVVDIYSLATVPRKPIDISACPKRCGGTCPVSASN